MDGQIKTESKTELPEKNISEQPIYILQQTKRRAIIPKAASFLILGIIFYLGILINISLLELSGRQETSVKTISLIVLIIITVIGITLSILRAKKTYNFYRDRIMFGKKIIYYQNIINTNSHKDLFDKLFKTYSINLGSKFFLRHIPQEINIQNYLKQMIDYAYKTTS